MYDTVIKLSELIVLTVRKRSQQPYETKDTLFKMAGKPHGVGGRKLEMKHPMRHTNDSKRSILSLIPMNFVKIFCTLLAENFIYATSS